MTPSEIIKNVINSSGTDWIEKELGTKFRKGRGSYAVKLAELGMLLDILAELREIKEAINHTESAKSKDEEIDNEEKLKIKEKISITKKK